MAKIEFVTVFNGLEHVITTDKVGEPFIFRFREKFSGYPEINWFYFKYREIVKKPLPIIVLTQVSPINFDDLHVKRSDWVTVTKDGFELQFNVDFIKMMDFNSMQLEKLQKYLLNMIKPKTV